MVVPDRQYFHLVSEIGLQTIKTAEYCFQLGVRVFLLQLTVCDVTDVDKSFRL